MFDPEGILDDDEDMEISTDEKETQTGNLSGDVKDHATQVNLRAAANSAGSQTGRRLQKMSTDVPDLIRSGQAGGQVPSETSAAAASAQEEQENHHDTSAKVHLPCLLRRQVTLHQQKGGGVHQRDPGGAAGDQEGAQGCLQRLEGSKL